MAFWTLPAPACVPVDDGGSEQVEAGNPVVLALGGSIADLALAADAQGILQRVVRLALVEADMGAAWGRQEQEADRGRADRGGDGAACGAG